jgi:hypothetical protein
LLALAVLVTAVLVTAEVPGAEGCVVLSRACHVQQRS